MLIPQPWAILSPHCNDIKEPSPRQLDSPMGGHQTNQKTRDTAQLPQTLNVACLHETQDGIGTWRGMETTFEEIGIGISATVETGGVMLYTW